MEQEELQTKGGMQKESIDTIMTVQCLCSVPTPEIIIKELYPLLKPGGQWLVYEHIKTKYQGDFVAYWQSEFDYVMLCTYHRILTLGQRESTLSGLTCSTGAISQGQQMNGCCRPERWQEVKLKTGEGENKYDTIPHVIGDAYQEEVIRVFYCQRERAFWILG